MEFKQPFIKLPVQFDAEALEQDVRALPRQSWVAHPAGFVGNEAVRLVTVNGEPNDIFVGPMRPTDNLSRSPYIQQVMAELGGVWSRSRLMGLGPGAQVPEHIDSHYHWRTHVRIHIPVITHPRVLFTCGGETVHMAAGECWLFDSFRFHRVKNEWTERRVHLVLDTVMTESLHNLIEAGQSGATITPKYIAPRPQSREDLLFEQFNRPPIMSPWEIRQHLAFILAHTTAHPKLPAISDRLERFADSWAAVWAQFGPNDEAASGYQKLIAECRTEVIGMATKDVVLTNTVRIMTILDSLIFEVALAPLTSRNVQPLLPQERRAS